jgi:prepilin-type processing-associated H-X9-DG protein
MYTGFNNDVSRSTFDPPLRDVPVPPRPLRDTFRVGSAHPATFNACFADGSVRAIAYGVDPATFRVHGDRTSSSPLQLD